MFSDYFFEDTLREVSRFRFQATYDSGTFDIIGGGQFHAVVDFTEDYDRVLIGERGLPFPFLGVGVDPQAGSPAPYSFSMIAPVNQVIFNGILGTLFFPISYLAGPPMPVQVGTWTWHDSYDSTDELGDPITVTEDATGRILWDGSIAFDLSNLKFDSAHQAPPNGFGDTTFENSEVTVTMVQEGRAASGVDPGQNCIQRLTFAPAGNLGVNGSLGLRWRGVDPPFPVDLVTVGLDSAATCASVNDSLLGVVRSLIEAGHAEFYGAQFDVAVRSQGAVNVEVAFIGSLGYRPQPLIEAFANHTPIDPPPEVPAPDYVSSVQAVTRADADLAVGVSASFNLIFEAAPIVNSADPDLGGIYEPRRLIGDLGFSVPTADYVVGPGGGFVFVGWLERWKTDTIQEFLAGVTFISSRFGIQHLDLTTHEFGGYEGAGTVTLVVS